ncbi:PEP-CTERM sorting domain-containing protein [Endozoicomonas sp. SM1973]|uniref:PEP-CTERM sorting domain-containing protein n=1 Tax=Spartinivicinus marinus TaxID=2994442 RepID=A0A853I2X4_9GAMM|nr:PEP-CTERM sorting domain-containing protein [Spartinivicinus marinus]MCX4029670.1 PEP-CTERM sorting domain-containing protein [Spartinivicinus marinus]NYZ66949.1 PEP-CTERM sorting domain-containing protein [Spartinivicinus marinus]
MNLIKATACVAFCSITSLSHASLIDFTGGTVHHFNGGTAVTDKSTNYQEVDYYVEDGVKFDFIGPSGTASSYNIGNYYGIENDVIHGHWSEGPYGDMESIFVNMLDGSAFDLNYFKITSNTSNGGGPASGNEKVYLNALADGVNISYSMLLPSDDWGFNGPNAEIFLGAEFDNISAFSITYEASAVGFGMDEFFINEEPTPIPEPISILSFALGLAGLTLNRKKTH